MVNGSYSLLWELLLPPYGASCLYRVSYKHIWNKVRYVLYWVTFTF